MSLGTEPQLAPPPRLLDGRGVLTFANDWTADPTSKHHIMRQFSRTNDVFWVEAAGMRAPRLSSAYDRARLLSKARAMLRHSRPVLDRVHVYSPPTLPYPQSRVARVVNRLLYRATIARELRRIDIGAPPLMWVFAPQCEPYIRDLSRRLTIYHCVDRWSAFADFDPKTLDRNEADLCRRADVIFASAEDLAERCRQYTSNVHYVPHGVDHAHFAAALEPGPIPEDIAEIPEPRIGFFGLIHEWVDTDLIGRLADALPFSFVVLGTAKGDMSALTRRRNVFHLGRRPYTSLPDYCRGFAAAIVPFRMTDLTMSVNPIKLREYAAAGLPVVSSPLPEVQRCADIAVCAESFDDWVDQLRSAVERGEQMSERRAQSARVEHQDWSFVCARMAELVNEAAASTGMESSQA
jgi:glycosyltransferase involved in cell wall biosynthesis